MKNVERSEQGKRGRKAPRKKQLLSLSLLAVGTVMAALSFGCGPVKAPIYDTCNEASDCTIAADDCYELEVDGFANAICSEECFSDADCPRRNGLSGVCEALDPTAPAICFEPCINPSDCLSGFTCSDVGLGGGTFICLPGR